MSDFYDALEVREPAERERDLLAALPKQIAHAQTAAPAFTKILDGVKAGDVGSREALARLPVTRKTDLLALQKERRASDPFGGFAAIARGNRMPRIFASPGTLYEPEGDGRDYWRTARALHAAGFRPGELAHNCFSYHMTPAGSIMESGLRAMGCTVFAGGIGQTEQQVEAMVDLKPEGYVGTPSFLKIILEKAQELKLPVPSVTKALVSGEAFPPSLRDWIDAHGVHGTQCYATADIGLIAYETSAREGLVLDEGVLVEIVRPGTGEPVPDGEVGEIVVTTFNPDYPLVRFGTGDLSAVLAGTCPTGRTNKRIKGWLGRADQTTKVRGMFVHPGQIAAVTRRFAEVQRARLVVEGDMGDDRMTLRLECSATPEGLSERVADAIREVTKLRGTVELVAPGTLPNDGKVIEDARSYK
ncbi:phenylacetate--CoA ligase family protein [Variovorax sp. PAMC 28711]|uniref:phenylacetate--CoA ligase family protein n=1 Tax=Variovorax sp. PAMC 28711 TaxID=1795631 RepID=UPI00078BF0F7|nr:AMP-binding protein [Variovorax sp. PAMC 28711]AMM26669.1 AMP-dependent synthetase [Variovorax sp. PAMC 28711]